MLVDAVSDNPPNDSMSAWNMLLMIVPESGAAGTLTFQDPADSMSSPPPPNYVFGNNGIGITVANSGNMLSAFDYLNPNAALGVPIPGSPGAVLLQMDFLASFRTRPDCSGSTQSKARPSRNGPMPMP